MMKDNDYLLDSQIMLNAEHDDDEQIDDDLSDALHEIGSEHWLRRCQRHGWQRDAD